MIFIIISFFYNKSDIFFNLSKKKIFIIVLLIYHIKELDILNNYKYFKFRKGINNIRIGIISNSLKNGGVERQTSLLLKYLNKIDIFKLYLFTREGKNKDDYIIDNDIKRITIEKNLIILFLMIIIQLFPQIYQQRQF